MKIFRAFRRGRGDALLTGSGRRGMAPAALPRLVRNKGPPWGNECMCREGSLYGPNWMGPWKKRTTSLIEGEKTALVFSVFTEKRKNAGLSLKSCAEYTKINGKFNRGFHGSPARSPTQNRSGARAGPCAPFWLPQKGSTLHFPSGAELPFSRLRGFIRAKCESAPAAPLRGLIYGR